jgi:L-ascorbate metabolism protein UlaG (beta-lactamase superfamily)
MKDTVEDTLHWAGDFVEEVSEELPGPGAHLWALGGPSFLYRTPSACIWIDPYFGGTPVDAVPRAYRATAIPLDPTEIRMADAVFSTHDHLDHCHEESVMPIIANTHAKAIAPSSSALLMRGWGLPEDRLHEVAAGDRCTIGDVEVFVYPGYDPNEPHAVTYVLETEGSTLFVSGDTWRGPGLAEVAERHSPTHALLAFGRTWYMSIDDFMLAARDLAPKTLLPFHWEFWRGHTGDVGELFAAYYRDPPSFAIKMLLVGDSLALTS